MNYNELVTAVSDYCENTFQTTDMNTFIRQAEQRIYNAAQPANLRKNMTSSLILHNKYIAPPADFLSMYSFAVVDQSGNYIYLLNKDVNFIREAYPSPSSYGTPKHYAIFGEQSSDPTNLTLIVGPTPDYAYSVELHYFYYPESIVTAGNTWLGDNFDSTLLYGTILEAFVYMRQEKDMMDAAEKRFSQAIALYKNLADGKQRMDAYRDGQVRISVS